MSANRRDKAIPADWVWRLLLLLVFLEYIRPMDWAVHGLSPLRLGGIATLTMALVWIRSKKTYIKEERVFLFVGLFWLLVTLSVVYAPNTRAAFNTSVEMAFNLLGFVFPLSMVLCTRERLYKYVSFWILIQVLLAIYVITHRGNGPGSYLWDENDVGLAINMALPYPIYMMQFPGMPVRKRFLLSCAVVLLAIAIGVTGSRGAVVGMGAVFLSVAVFSDRPIRNLILGGVVAALLVSILLVALPEKYIGRVKSMSDPQNSTRVERLYSWSIGWQMYLANPVLGVGADNYAWTNHLYASRSPMYDPRKKLLGGRAAHSLYFTLLSELGTAGVVIYVSLFGVIISRYRAIVSRVGKKESASVDERKFSLLFRAYAASSIGFLSTGAFITVLYYPPFWHLMGLIAATSILARREIDSANPESGAVVRTRARAVRAVGT